MLFLGRLAVFQTFLKTATIFFAIFFLSFLCFTPNIHAQTDSIPEEKRTVYMIGDIDNAFGNYPLLVFIVNGNQLILAEEWNAWEEGIGPVGLAVDDVNERLFVSYESHDGVDIYNARNMNYINEITLAGTSDLAGMEVHQASGRLLVVDRFAPTLYEFNLSNYALADQWTLPNCEGAIGIDSAGDILYVTCGHYNSVTTFWEYTNIVHAYDLTSQTEVAQYTLPYMAAGIAVTDYPETTIYAAGHFNHDYFTQYYTASGIHSSVDLDDGGKGVTLNPALDLAYVVKGYGGPFCPWTERGAIRVYDVNNLTQQYEYVYDPGFDKPSPTDAVASTIPFGGTVSKELTSHPGGIIQEGDAVVFTVTIENRHTSRIHVLPVRDTYDVNHLEYSHSIPASDDNNDDGQIDFADIVASVGHDIWPGNTVSIELHFTADPNNCDDQVEGMNLAQMIGAQDISGFTLVDAAGRADYVIECGCLVAADCDDGLFCNGPEDCVAGSCVDGVEPCGDDNLFCNGTESCNETFNSCQHSGDPCTDDGLFCNGDEACNETNDSCTHSGDPCTDDGLFCNGEESCNETNDQCDVINIPDCSDDGEFCNGDEFCDEAGDACASSGDPCADDGAFCNGVESCNETADQCENSGDPCPDDGVFCNGDENCNESTDSCGSSGDPCVDDGNFCNGEETCDEASAECLHSGDPCPDDGLYCNGAEACDPQDGSCVSSGDPCADDGKYCNGEENCSEENDTCVSSGDPCPPGEYCLEETDTCSSDPDSSSDDDDTGQEEEDMWPEGEVTGGCCGC